MGCGETSGRIVDSEICCSGPVQAWGMWALPVLLLYELTTRSTDRGRGHCNDQWASITFFKIEPCKLGSFEVNFCTSVMTSVNSLGKVCRRVTLKPNEKSERHKGYMR